MPPFLYCLSPPLFRIHYKRTFAESLAFFVDIYDINASSVENGHSLGKPLIKAPFCSGNERGRFSRPLVLHLFEICFNHILQKFFPINAGNQTACAIMVGDISGIFRQYVPNDLTNRIIPFFLQSSINPHHSFLLRSISQFSHLNQSIP